MSDEREQALAESLVGRTIVRAKFFDTAPDVDWTGHDEGWLWLDDGRVVVFGAWGHDAWGATIEEIEVMDIASCRACGNEHRDRVVHREGKRAKVYCEDGYRLAWTEGYKRDAVGVADGVGSQSPEYP